MRLAEMTAVVTGGGRGLGKAFALAIAKEGADVAIYDVNTHNAEKTAKEIRSLGRSCISLLCDVSDKNDIVKATARVKEDFGKIDILVNNAGISKISPARETSEELWDRTISINLKGTYLCNQIIGRVMVEQGGGRIVNIASIASSHGAPGGLAYHASKAGIVALTKLLGVEWAKYKVYVNSISPGTIRTEGSSEKLDWLKGSMKRIPMQRYGNPEEVANLVLFLVSPETTYITGQDFIIDGGACSLLPTYVEKDS